jgi:NTP pyrophosphatase (non-canonical NTP hydrolase)
MVSLLQTSILNGDQIKIKDKTVSFYKKTKILFFSFHNPFPYKREKLENLFQSDIFDQYVEYCYSGFQDNKMSDEELNMVHASIGLIGEAGEYVEEIKKMVFHNKPLSRDRIKSELGDVLWYFCVNIRLWNLSISDIIIYNKQKLNSRYPNGRSENYQIRNKEKFE